MSSFGCKTCPTCGKDIPDFPELLTLHARACSWTPASPWWIRMRRSSALRVSSALALGGMVALVLCEVATCH